MKTSVPHHRVPREALGVGYDAWADGMVRALEKDSPVAKTSHEQHAEDRIVEAVIVCLFIVALVTAVWIFWPPAIGNPDTFLPDRGASHSVHR